MQSFIPNAQDPRKFRDALGKYATGVCVITTDCPRGPLGITANSFVSVSLDPPMVLWCPARYSRRYEAFTTCESFAIHVLAQDQLELARHFTGDGLDFAPLKWSRGADDVPLLEGCLARFECENYSVTEAGDHAVVIGQVIRAATREGAPLMFLDGRFQPG
jgi:flavin reductase (DIM6/NTAB) family NADH-FMN oxidoreductase RutF